MTSIKQKWRKYLMHHCEAEIKTVREEYPRNQSVTVDLIDVHDYDSDFVQLLFDSPVKVLSQGTVELRDVVDVDGSVQLHIKNNPHQIAVGSITAHHLHRLLTVRGVVDSVYSIGATVTRAVFECPACDAVVTEPQSHIELDTPVYCDQCAQVREFDFRPEESVYSDLQQIKLVPAPDATDKGVRDSLSVYLDGDLVGAVSTNDYYCITGIVRGLEVKNSNTFSLYLDSFGIQDEQNVAPPDSPDNVLDAYWDK